MSVPAVVAGASGEGQTSGAAAAAMVAWIEKKELSLARPWIAWKASSASSGAGSRDRQRAGWTYFPQDVRRWPMVPRFGLLSIGLRARPEAHRMATGPPLGRAEDAKSIEDNRFISPTHTGGA